MNCHTVDSIKALADCAYHCITVYGPWFVTMASAASAVLPKAKAGTLSAFFQQFIELVAMNFGHAKDEHRP